MFKCISIYFICRTVFAFALWIRISHTIARDSVSIFIHFIILFLFRFIIILRFWIIAHRTYKYPQYMSLFKQCFRSVEYIMQFLLYDSRMDTNELTQNDTYLCRKFRRIYSNALSVELKCIVFASFRFLSHHSSLGCCCREF